MSSHRPSAHPAPLVTSSATSQTTPSTGTPTSAAQVDARLKSLSRKAGALLRAIRSEDPLERGIAAERFAHIPWVRPHTPEQALAVRAQFRHKHALLVLALEAGHPSWDEYASAIGRPAADGTPEFTLGVDPLDLDALVDLAPEALTEGRFTTPAPIPVDWPAERIPATEEWLGEHDYTEAFVLTRVPSPFEDALPGTGPEELVVATNIPHLCVLHSPSGFEYGYRGAGPSDTALNMIEATLRVLRYVGPREMAHRGTCFALSLILHTDARDEFLSELPPDGGRIPFLDVAAWIIRRAATLNIYQRDRCATLYAAEAVLEIDEDNPIGVGLADFFMEALREPDEPAFALRADGIYRRGERIARRLDLTEYERVAHRVTVMNFA